MFTGIIQAIGEIHTLEPRGGDVRLILGTGKLEMTGFAPSDSIAVNGVCLTAVLVEGSGLAADVSRETLALTTLGDLRTGSRVNLEPALTLTTPLGGHLMSGHVDGVGKVLDRREDARSIRFAIEAPPALARYIAHKGSIGVDGVSLTVNDVKGRVFDLNIIPHTLQETTMSAYGPGSRVNLEVDLLARYIERLVFGDRAVDPDAQGITAEFLAEHGFLHGTGS